MDLKKINNYQTQTQQINNVNNTTNKAPETTKTNTQDTNVNPKNTNQDYIKMLNENGVGNNVDKTI